MFTNSTNISQINPVGFASYGVKANKHTTISIVAGALFIFCPKMVISDASICRGDASISNRILLISRGDASISRRDVSISNSLLLISRGDASISRGDASISNRLLLISRGDASISKGDASISRGDASISRGDASISRGDASISINQISPLQGVLPTTFTKMDAIYYSIVFKNEMVKPKFNLPLPET